MGRYILRRLVMLVPVLLGVSFVTFALIRLVPGDIVTNMMGVTAAQNPEVRARVLHELGLDRPLLEQYLWWLGRILRGDLGYSFIHGTPVLGEVSRRYPITLQLTAMSMTIALAIGIPMGILSATRRGTLIDYLARVFSLVGISTPNFFVGTLIVVVGALYFPYISTMGYVPIMEDATGSMARMLWPALSLGVAIAAIVLRYTRSCVLEVLGENYVRTARAKGLRDRAVLFVHVLKNGLIPVITTVGVWTAYLLGGTVILEEVFAIPGLGRLVLGSIWERDYPMIQGAVLFLALNVTVVLIVVDILIALVDPRVSLGS